MSKVLSIWKNLSDKPFGKKIFSAIICKKAPYFSTIKPTISKLEPGVCEVLMKNKKGVQNHLGTIHAIAMCNMAELAGGTLTDIMMPKNYRWIPKGMTVNYLKKADTDLIATAKIDTDTKFLDSFNLPVSIEITNQTNEIVFTAVINMWISPKTKS